MALVTLPDGTVIRPARTSDVRGIRTLVDEYANERRLLSKATVELYEHVQEFLVAEHEGEIVGCGALHVVWEDLGEVRTMAVHAELRHKGVGGIILELLIERGRELGLERLFCLTF